MAFSLVSADLVPATSSAMRSASARHLGRHAVGLGLGIHRGLVDDPLKSRNFRLQQRDLILRYPRCLGEGRLGRCQGA